MDGKQKKACIRCRSLKMKCDRSTPGCDRCKKSDQPCSYPTDGTLRIRNQTDAVAVRATQQWRARSKAAQRESSKSTTPPTPSPERSINPPIVELAHRRFLHDFTQIDTGSFFKHLGTLVDPGQHPGNSNESGMMLALSAVSLANFHRRQHDQRACRLAWEAHGKALSKMGDALSDPEQPVSYDLVLMAVFLALFQNIYREDHMIGAWIYHFRGAVNLLISCQNDSAEHLQLSQFLVKQAVMSTIRMDIPIKFPLLMQLNLDSWNCLESRAMKLSFQVVNCAADREDQLKGVQFESFAFSEYVSSLHTELTILEQDLMSAYPYDSIPAGPNSYPQWYWPISAFPGGPTQAHTYFDIRAAVVWNIYRMTRLKLCTIIVQMEATAEENAMMEYNEVYQGSASMPQPFSMPSEAIVTTLTLIEEICSSVFSILTHRCDGKPNPTSLQDVPGGQGLGLVTPLGAVYACRSQPALAPYVPAERLDWTENVLKVLHEEVGVAEAWIWHDENEAEDRALIRQQLAFTN